MKKTLKVILSLACVIAMIASLGIGALAYTDAELEEMIVDGARAQDAIEIQNVMNWHVMYHCYGEHRAELLNIWVQEPENQATASFGQNQGFMVGYGSIWDAYVEGHDTSWLQSAKRYCQQNNIDITGWTDDQILDVYGGVGQLLLHVTTTAIIEVARDGKTAKAFWYSPGMIAESGSSGNTIWEAYGADFVKENGVWKMWHLHMFTDFMGGFYLTLGQGGSGGPSGESSGEAAGNAGQEHYEGEGGNVLYHAGLIESGNYDPSTTHDYLYSQQYTEFSHDRLRSDMEIFLPVAYDSWSFDDPNYGPTKAEFESYGIDLDAWYAAHK
jgi:hypothetical protein